MQDIETIIDGLIRWGADPNAAIKRMLGDEELFFKLMNDFIKSPDWDMLLELINNESFKDAFVIAHRMKGSSADLSLTPLYESLCYVTDDLRGEVEEILYSDVESLIAVKENLYSIICKQN